MEVVEEEDGTVETMHQAIRERSNGVTQFLKAEEDALWYSITIEVKGRKGGRTMWDEARKRSPTPSGTSLGKEVTNNIIKYFVHIREI
ncbi:hypothetical protein E2C01_045966 [Portunus trituberculatus]|uniref:Uncharacterized protein n=1 Tax=Portunus trituberculatus TaxID=210409 RepID=A0A5B7G2S7_PORTR|nr:hypothetical protein [Portunus trituberculatus]